MTKKIITRDGGQKPGRQVSAVPGKHPRLSDAALILLGVAAGRADGLILPPPASCQARGRALERVLGSLLKTTLVSEVPVATDEQAWRRDETGNRIGLQITDHGRHVLGLPTPEPNHAESPPAGEAMVSVKDREGGRPIGSAAGSQIVDEELSAESIAGLAASLPERRTKQARLVRLLSEPAGQSVAALGQALGWQPHTVRAALTGLRQRGLALRKEKGASGTTMYRIELGAKATSANTEPKAA